MSSRTPRSHLPLTPPERVVHPGPAGKILATEVDYAKAVLPTSEAPDTLPGALVRGRVVDPEPWAVAGVPHSRYAIYTGRAIDHPADCG